MANDEEIKTELINKFDFLKDKIRVQRARRIFTDYLDLKQWEKVFDYIVDEKKYDILLTITGLDEGENLGFIYHLAHENGNVINLKSFVPKKNPVIKSITERLPIAELYERELVDMFGAVVEGLPEGLRYPLPDDWPQGEFHLRKDWQPETPEKKEEVKANE